MTFAKASHSCGGFFSVLVLACGLLLVETGLSGSVAQAQSEGAAPVATIGEREIRQDGIDAFLANLQRQSGETREAFVARGTELYLAQIAAKALIAVTVAEGIPEIEAEVARLRASLS